MAKHKTARTMTTLVLLIILVWNGIAISIGEFSIQVDPLARFFPEGFWGSVFNFVESRGG